MTKTRREAFRFFHEWGASRVGEAALQAMELARAEDRFTDLEAYDRARFVWEYDQDADISWMDARDLTAYEAGRLEVLWVRLEVWHEDTRTGFGAWETVASLGGVSLLPDQASQNYRRVVEAELASEALTA